MSVRPSLRRPDGDGSAQLVAAYLEKGQLDKERLVCFRNLSYQEQTNTANGT